MRVLLKYGVVAVVILKSLVAMAQPEEQRFVDTLARKLDSYRLKKQEAVLYAHFDKTVYTCNENIWFTAYLLSTHADTVNRVLSAILVKDQDKVILLEERFVMSSGIAVGKLLLPDTLSSGNYRVILYTNSIVKGAPAAVYRQSITIKNTVSASAAKASTQVAGLRGNYNSTISVNFYPEGGSLSVGLSSVVGWEVKGSHGMPIKTTGMLLKDGKLLDTIHTNSYGMGNFKLILEANSRYAVRLSLNDLKDTVVKLPQALSNRPVIAIDHAVADDTLRLTVLNKQPAKCYIVVHNYRQLFFYLPANVNARGKSFKIALTNLPKGIAAVMVLDSLHRPCSERLFFAHYNQHNVLKISTDKTWYHARQQVKLDLKLYNSEGKSITGLVSIACVQANRLDLAKTTTIEKYLYLTYELGALPVKESYLADAPEDKADLENLLLIKGWRNYIWSDLEKATAADTAQQQKVMLFTGRVTRRGKPLKQPITLVVMRDTSFQLLATNATGRFTLRNELLFTTDGKKLRLMVSGAHPEEYEINITNPYQAISQSLALHAEPDNYANSYSISSSDKNTGFTGLDNGVFNLRTVTIKGYKDDSFYNTSRHQNACGDYVCLYGFLNCPLHINDDRSTVPVKGTSYKVYDGSAAAGGDLYHQVVYQGCDTPKDEFSKLIDGIHYTVAYYPADYARYNPTEPEYLSTIYWKHLYKISPEGNSPLSFYTSDVTGKFKIIVQGVTEEGVVYAEKTIDVNKP